jgi:hypothetical protein
MVETEIYIGMAVCFAAVAWIVLELLVDEWRKSRQKRSPRTVDAQRESEKTDSDHWDDGAGHSGPLAAA